MLKKRVPEKLRELIRNFQLNQERYHSKDYSETELRVGFLNPLFRLLGWDVDNQAGCNHDATDVLQEKYLSDLKLRPDYIFKVGGVEKFILEAKRPYQYVEKADSVALQVHNYRYSIESVKIVILSDFEYFAIYECLTEPQETVTYFTSCLFSCGFEEYPQYFQFLYSFLSKEAVMTGLHDKIVSELENFIINSEQKIFLTDRFNLLYSVFENVTEKQLISVTQDTEISLNASHEGEGSAVESKMNSAGLSSVVIPSPSEQSNSITTESVQDERVFSIIKDFKSEVLGEVVKLQQQIASEARAKSLTVVEAEDRFKIESEKFVSITNNFKSEVLGEIIKLQQHISNEAQTKSLATVVVQDHVKAENEKEYLSPKDFRDEILGEIVKLQQYIASEARKETPATALTHAHLKIENEKIFSIIKDFKSEIQGEIVKLQQQISSETQERAQALFLAHERINRRNESLPSKGQDMSRQPVFYLSPILPLQQMH